jgi:hypothetical protein
MKKFKRITIWMLLSLVLQSAGLLYLDKFYFVTETNFKTKKIETPTAKPQKEEVQIKVPNSAKHVSISYDGKFIAYYEDDTLEVVNTLTGTKNQVSFDKDEKVSYYKWLPDINTMIIAEKKTTAKGDTLTFSNYDVQKNKKKDISVDSKGKTNFITLPDKQSEVEDIELSPLTNMIYIKINHNGNKNSVYSMNVMSRIEKLKLNSYLTGSILTFPHEARMAYEDVSNSKIYATGISKPISIKEIKKPILIASDEEDRLYIGNQEGDKVSKIFYGLVKDPTEKWKSIELNTPVDKKDIFISSEGNIYVNNNLKGTVTNLTTVKETSYKGKFLQMYNGGIAAISDGKLIKINLEK